MSPIIRDVNKPTVPSFISLLQVLLSAVLPTIFKSYGGMKTPQNRPKFTFLGPNVNTNNNIKKLRAGVLVAYRSGYSMNSLALKIPVKTVEASTILDIYISSAYIRLEGMDLVQTRFAEFGRNILRRIFGSVCEDEQ